MEPAKRLDEHFFRSLLIYEIFIPVAFTVPEMAKIVEYFIALSYIP